MPIIYRTPGAWGAGKGSNLAAAEVDGNFYDHDGRIAALEALPIGASIDYFAIIGASLYVHLTDHSMLGPYALPVAQWRLRGEWQPAMVLVANDVLTYGGRVYLVTFDHISADTFDPGANDGSGHDYYGLLLGNPDPIVDLALYYPDRVRAAGAVLFQHVVVRAMTLPTNLTESRAYLRVAPATDDVLLLLYRNADQVGSLVFSVSDTPDIDGGMAGTFVFDAAMTFNAGDRFSVVENVGTEDTMAEGLSITIKATAA
jgi:hypothetical protein